MRVALHVTQIDLLFVWRYSERNIATIGIKFKGLCKILLSDRLATWRQFLPASVTRNDSWTGGAPELLDSIGVFRAVAALSLGRTPPNLVIPPVSRQIRL